MKLLSETQSRILGLLKVEPVLSIDQITLKLKMAKTAVRRQLLAMERRGLVEREYQPLERGRPALRFRLSSASNQLFPSKEAEILSDLTKYLIHNGHEELLEEFFEQYWQKRLNAILAAIKKRGRDDFKTRLEVLKEAMDREGFMPTSRYEKRGTEVVLRECHCPIEAIAHVTRLPCQIEKRLISKVLNAPISSFSIRPENERGCEFRLPTPKITSKRQKQS